MATEFRITEIRPTWDRGTAAKFIWTSSKQPSDPALGGARACPQDVMEIGGKQAMVRAKKPGAIFPSFQILGPDREPIQLHGRWDDRYNFRGYAVQEMRSFEEMCRRGNQVLVSVGQQGFVGFLSDWKFSYKRDWDIGYSFTVAIHSREDEASAPAMPNQAKDPSAVMAGLNRQADAVAETHYRRPESSIYAKTMKAINSALGQVSVGLGIVADKLSTKTGILSPIGDFKALATQLRSIQGNCSNVLNQLVTARADVQMTCRTAKDVVNFESWSKSMGSQLRLLRHGSRQGALACDQRAQPAIMGTYRPRKGQSLYSVSQDVYGTPFGWRPIYTANRLTSTILDGTKVLDIPAGGAA